MSQDSTKQILLSVLAICVLIISVVGVSYAIYDGYTDSNVLTYATSGTIIYQYKENNEGFYASITDYYNREDLLSITEGNNIFNFKVLYNSKDNINAEYEINLTDITSKSSKNIDTKYIKVLLTEVVNGKEIILLDEYYDRLPSSNIRKNSKILKTDNIDNNTKEKEYLVKLYIAKSLNNDFLIYEEDIYDELGNLIKEGNGNSKFEAKIGVANY